MWGVSTILHHLGFLSGSQNQILFIPTYFGTTATFVKTFLITRMYYGFKHNIDKLTEMEKYVGVDYVYKEEKHKDLIEKDWSKIGDEEEEDV